MIKFCKALEYEITTKTKTDLVVKVLLCGSYKDHEGDEVFPTNVNWDNKIPSTVDFNHNMIHTGCHFRKIYVQNDVYVTQNDVTLKKALVGELVIPEKATLKERTLYGTKEYANVRQMILDGQLTGVSIKAEIVNNVLHLFAVSILDTVAGSEHSEGFKIIEKKFNMDNKNIIKCLCDLPVSTYVTNPEKTGIWSIVDVTDTNKTIQNIDTTEEDIFDDTMAEWNHYFAVSEEDVMQYMASKKETYTVEKANKQKNALVKAFQKACAMCNAKKVIEKELLPAEEVGTKIDAETQVANLEAKFVEMQTDFMAKFESIQTTIDAQNTKIAELQPVELPQDIQKSLNDEKQEIQNIRDQVVNYIKQLDESKKLNSKPLPKKEISLEDTFNKLIN